jgi:hypothetical protein
MGTKSITIVRAVTADFFLDCRSASIFLDVTLRSSVDGFEVLTAVVMKPELFSIVEVSRN